MGLSVKKKSCNACLLTNVIVIIVIRMIIAIIVTTVMVITIIGLTRGGLGILKLHAKSRLGTGSVGVAERLGR